jgi:hypothetical protein
VRSTAGAALLQFLLDYPLSPSRLQGHMLFLLTNTAYQHEEGRLQALEMLQQVGHDCVHLNFSQVQQKFLPAVTVVANSSTPAYMHLVPPTAAQNSNHPELMFSLRSPVSRFCPHRCS